MRRLSISDAMEISFGLKGYASGVKGRLRGFSRAALPGIYEIPCKISLILEIVARDELDMGCVRRIQSWDFRIERLKQRESRNFWADASSQVFP